MPVHSVLNYKKSLCLALLIVPLVGHNAAFGQPPKGELPGAIDPAAANRAFKLPEKEQLLSDLKGNDARKRMQALELFSRGSVPLSEAEAVPLYTSLIRVDLPVASPKELNDLDEFNARLIDELSNFGEKARPALPKLLAIVSSRDHSVVCRFSAQVVLGIIAPHDPEVARCYIDQLKSDTSIAKSYIVSKMPELAADGFDISEVLPLIRKMVDGEAESSDSTTFYTLGRIQQTKATKKDRDLKRLIGNLKRFKTGSYDQAAFTLLSIQELKTAAKATQPLLRDLFQKESNDSIKAALLETLGSTGLGNNLALTRLVLNASATGDLTEKAYDVLKSSIQKTDTKSIAFLVAALQPERHPQLFSEKEQQTVTKSPVKIAIIRALTPLQESAGVAVLPVAEIFRSEALNKPSNQTVMGVCLNLLSTIGPAASASAPMILDVLQPQTTPLSFVDDSRKGLENRYALLKLASGLTITDEKLQREALDIAIDGLKQKNATIYAESARMAGSLGSRAGDAIPYLLPALATDFNDTALLEPFVSKVKDYRRELDFFEKPGFRGSDSDAISESNRLFKERISPRLAAMRAVGEIGMPAAAPAMPLLEEWTKESAKPLYRLVAGDALKVLRGE